MPYMGYQIASVVSLQFALPYRASQESMDNVLVFGKDTQEHDARLEKVLQQIQAAGATLNQEKC